jgi:hypothetical protein
MGGPVLDIQLHLRPDGESNLAHINGSGVTKAVLLTRAPDAELDGAFGKGEIKYQVPRDGPEMKRMSHTS